jgi:hypothetical protein
MRLGTTPIDASQEILKIDYDVPGNPRFLVHDRVDEVVEVDVAYYLGRSLMHSTPLKVKCWACFTLGEIVDPGAGECIMTWGKASVMSLFLNSITK